MCNDGEEIRFKGVRKRKRGKYVAEIRSGKRSRISLGSYFTAEAAARAYDTALLCLRGPHASSFNFPDSQFNSTALNVGNAENNPSANSIRTAAIAVGSEFDNVPVRCHDHNLDTGSSADKEASTEFCQAVYDLKIADNVEEEEDMDEANDTKYLLQSPEEILFKERVQMSLLLPEEEMLQAYNPSEIFADLGTLDKTIFQAAPAKPHT